MKNIKSIIISAASGFILSLVFGLFSGSGFFKILLTALVAGLIFAVLGFLVSFIYEKFLMIESSDVESQPAANTTDSAASNVGNNVDIVIEDQELERSESSNRYSVGDNFSMLHDSDVISEKNEPSPAASNNTGFVPVRNLETLTNFSGSEAVKPSEIKPVENKNDSEQLDVLPDFSDSIGKTVPVSNAPGGESDSDDDSLDSGFSGSISVSSYSKKNDIDTEKFQNTELIAKAISSVLSDEE